MNGQNEDVALHIPRRLAVTCRRTSQGAAWLDGLPNALLKVQRRWALKPGSPLAGAEMSCAWVAPMVLPDGRPAVLKLAMPHMEGEHESDALRFWNGDGSVRLIEADTELGAMLLERCHPGTPLRLLPEPEQDIVIARLLRRLWRLPAPPYPFRRLSVMTEYWSTETLADAGRWPDPGLVREGLRLFWELPRTAPVEVLLATDLHAGNVLKSEREPWLAIDPKPFVGDPAYDATQHLLNCRERLHTNPHATISRFADLLGLDPGRVRLWTFARAATERGYWRDPRLLTLARTIAP